MLEIDWKIGKEAKGLIFVVGEAGMCGTLGELEEAGAWEKVGEK